jgi:S1-C subfamily serine protease
MVKKIKRAVAANERQANKNVLDIVKKMQHAVVMVNVIYQDGTAGFGTGFIVADGNYALTAAHVIKGVQTISLSVPSGDKIDCSIEVGKQCFGKQTKGGIEKIWEIDVGILRLQNKLPTVLPVEMDSDVAKTGEEVVFIGYPGGGLNRAGREISFNPIPLVTKGIVSGLLRTSLGEGIFEYYFWVDKPSFSGNSGGPVFRVNTGKVTGIITAAPYMPQKA